MSSIERFEEAVAAHLALPKWTPTEREHPTVFGVGITIPTTELIRRWCEAHSQTPGAGAESYAKEVWWEIVYRAQHGDKQAASFRDARSRADQARLVTR